MQEASLNAIRRLNQNQLEQTRDDEGARAVLERIESIERPELDATPYVTAVADLVDGVGVGAPYIDAREQACDFSCDGLQCVLACPTGALTAKMSIGKGRNWEYRSVKTTCSYCGVGCQLSFPRRMWLSNTAPRSSP